jgi:hypothetical protein
MIESIAQDLQFVQQGFLGGVQKEGKEKTLFFRKQQKCRPKLSVIKGARGERM